MNAIAATKLIVQHMSHESEALADLLVSIRTRLADAVANLMVCSENQHLQLLVRKYTFMYLILSLKKKKKIKLCTYSYMLCSFSASLHDDFFEYVGLGANMGL